MLLPMLPHGPCGKRACVARCRERWGRRRTGGEVVDSLIVLHRAEDLAEFSKPEFVAKDWVMVGASTPAHAQPAAGAPTVFAASTGLMLKQSSHDLNGAPERPANHVGAPLVQMHIRPDKRYCSLTQAWVCLINVKACMREAAVTACARPQ